MSEKLVTFMEKVGRMSPQSVIQIMLVGILVWLLFFHIPTLTESLGMVAEQLSKIDVHLTRLADRIESLEEFERAHHK